jgi:NAD(P)-dependent dehydrogenase (short-subunit alcohol dehydrogenase family)
MTNRNVETSERGRTRYDGRVAVVTDGESELGRRVSELLAERGAAVVVNGGDGAAHVAEQIRSSRGRAVSCAANLVDPQGAATAVADAVRSFGQIDIIVNNAGSSVDARFQALTTRLMVDAWTSRVSAAFNVLKAAWPHLNAQGYGRVVNVSAVTGLLDGRVSGRVADDVAYGGLIGMTRALAASGSPAGIRVNAVLLSPEAGDGAGASDVAFVAPLVAWLAHEDCLVGGKFVTAESGRVMEVFASAAAGYQCRQPSAFSAEDVRENWATVRSTAGSTSPMTSAEYNAFRVGIYEASVT